MEMIMDFNKANFRELSIAPKRARYDDCESQSDSYILRRCSYDTDPLSKLPRDHSSQDISDAKNRMKFQRPSPLLPPPLLPSLFAR